MMRQSSRKRYNSRVIRNVKRESRMPYMVHREKFDQKRLWSRIKMQLESMKDSG
ncbi:MAG TPA: hypothetical protein IAC99_10405 [Candidatus Choladocola avistercoris]|nr:hypothetical protein [Candidatus Choladocola avistercoris]